MQALIIYALCGPVVLGEMCGFHTPPLAKLSGRFMHRVCMGMFENESS